MRILISSALIIAAPLFAGLSTNAQAKDPVVTLQPMTGAHLPTGSQISSERLQVMDTKIRALKAKQKSLQQAPSKETVTRPENELR